MARKISADAQLKKNIRNIMKEQNVSYEELAKRTSYTKDRIFNMLNLSIFDCMSTKHLMDILEALNTKFELVTVLDDVVPSKKSKPITKDKLK